MEFYDGVLVTAKRESDIVAVKMARFTTRIAFGLTLFTAGCDLISPVPSELRPIKLTQTNSASVEIGWCEIEKQKDGRGFVIDGYVVRKPNALTTTRTRLHIRFLDSQGRILREEITGFRPREIRDWKVRGEPDPKANYALPFKNVPYGTTRIEVRALDEF